MRKIATALSVVLCMGIAGPASAGGHIPSPCPAGYHLESSTRYVWVQSPSGGYWEQQTTYTCVPN